MRKALLTVTALLFVFMLSGCLNQTQLPERKRFIGTMTEAGGTLYVATANMRGVREWRSELWGVDVATASARKLAVSRQLTKFIRVDSAGNILASVPRKPDTRSRNRDAFEAWLYDKANGFHGRRLGEGQLVGAPVPDAALTSRTFLDPSALRDDKRPATDDPVAELRTLDGASTTYLELLPYNSNSAPTELGHWKGMVGFTQQGCWIVSQGHDESGVYELTGSRERGWRLRKTELQASSPVAISLSGEMATVSVTTGTLHVLKLARPTSGPATPLGAGRVDEMVWSHDGRTLAVSIEGSSALWKIMEINPTKHLSRILWTSSEKPRALTPVGPSAFAIVTGSANEKQTVVMLPGKKALFEWH
ncbi:MAG: hypothetical protein ABFD96_09235 [Armatimonadia bacterium]